jgi:hypothetical protein
LGISIDSNGNIYVTGTIGGNIYSGNGDAFIAKYDTNGGQLWLKQFGTSQLDEGLGISIDSNDFIYVTGKTSGSLSGNINLGGYSDAFVAKYDTNGTQIWVKQFGSSGSDSATAISADSSGNVLYAAGSTDGSLPGNSRFSVFGDAFVAGFDANGNLLLPSITLEVSPSSVIEDSATNLVYTFTRTGPTANALTVTYDITGTADATDYTGATPGTGKTITFAANSATATLTLDPTADTTIEPDETVILTLASGTGYTIGTTTSITGSITNDDLPTLSINDATITEGNSGTQNLTFTVTRTGTAFNPITVNYATNDQTATTGSDYTASNGTLNFATNETSKTITVAITGDTSIENDETFLVNLTNPSNATLTDAQGIGIITNDDLPSITLAVSPANVAEDAATNLVYTFTRTGPTANALTVTYDITGTADATDYTGATSGTGKTITFAANSATATLTLDPTADTTVEPDETAILTLASGTGYTIGTTTPITATITNDDVASYGSKLTTPIIRFQNTDKPGTYLFAGEQEAASIRQNYKGFKEEGLAFQVAVNKDDPLMQPFYRFQNTTKGREGTYLFADEKEAISIRQNYKNFKEEGLAFYAYSAGVEGGTTDFARFQNKNVPGTYLFTGPSETSSVLKNFPGFTLEGSAFAAG